MSQTGLIEDGVYIDSTKLFSIEFQRIGLSKKEILSASADCSCGIEWKNTTLKYGGVPGTQYRPVPREDCLGFR